MTKKFRTPISLAFFVLFTGLALFANPSTANGSNAGHLRIKFNTQISVNAQGNEYIAPYPAAYFRVIVTEADRVTKHYYPGQDSLYPVDPAWYTCLSTICEFDLTLGPGNIDAQYLPSTTGLGYEVQIYNSDQSSHLDLGQQTVVESNPVYNGATGRFDQDLDQYLEPLLTLTYEENYVLPASGEGILPPVTADFVPVPASSYIDGYHVNALFLVGDKDTPGSFFVDLTDTDYILDVQSADNLVSDGGEIQSPQPGGPHEITVSNLAVSSLILDPISIQASMGTSTNRPILHMTGIDNSWTKPLTIEESGQINLVKTDELSSVELVFSDASDGHPIIPTVPRITVKFEPLSSGLETLEEELIINKHTFENFPPGFYKVTYDPHPSKAGVEIYPSSSIASTEIPAGETITLDVKLCPDAFAKYCEPNGSGGWKNCEKEFDEMQQINDTCQEDLGLEESTDPGTVAPPPSPDSGNCIPLTKDAAPWYFQPVIGVLCGLASFLESTALPMLDITLPYVTSTGDVINVDPRPMLGGLIDSPTNVYDLWVVALTITNTAALLFFVYNIYRMIFSAGKENYTLKAIMGRFLIGLVLANFSWYICSFLFDIATILANIVRDVMGDIGIVDFQKETDVMTIFLRNWVGALGTVGVGVGVGIFAILGSSQAWGCIVTALGGIVAAVVSFVIVLVFRMLYLYLMVIIAPIIFGLSVIPEWKDLSKEWLKGFAKVLFIYPLAFVVYYLCIGLANSFIDPIS